MRRRLLQAMLGLGACWLAGGTPAQGQLRIVDYNIAENYNIQTDTGGLNLILGAIGAEVVNGFARPVDVVALQEANTDGSDAASVAGILNELYGVTTYMAAPVPGNGLSLGNGLPGLVYNSATVGLVGTYAFGTVNSSNQPRSSLRFHLRPAGYDAAADFFIYNNHYKSDDNPTDRERRRLEAVGVRDNSDLLGEGTHAIYVGDFNVYSSSEPMYVELLSAGAGQAKDPVNVPGAWSTSSPELGETFKKVHTQSPATASYFSGQVLGGMDDRFDFQLITGELDDDEGMSILDDSYRAFGNNGSHAWKQSISTGTGAAADVLLALTRVSDHLPVVADYQTPAKMLVAVDPFPMFVGVGASVPVNLLVQNVAPALLSLGADELDYALSVSGSLMGSGGGTIAALGAAAGHTVMLDTSTPGMKTGTIVVTSTSQGAGGAAFSLPVTFFVGGGGGYFRRTVAKDDFDAPMNLASFVQTPAAGGFPNSPQSGFQRYQMGVSPFVPSALRDDSGVATTDSQGVVNTRVKADGWFGVTDTVNPDNPGGNVAATWTFDVAGATSLEVSIDMGAMGDFEAADVFNWTYALDGGAFQPLFTSSVDEAGSFNYTLAGGAVENLPDPLRMMNTASQIVMLSNVFQTLTSAITGVGNLLAVRLNARTDAQSEAYVFDNILVTGIVPVFAEADFDNSGAVDAADLAAWQTNLGLGAGALKTQGDADADGDVDGADFLVWQRQMGLGVAAVPAQLPVPEPSSAALAALLAVVGGGWRRALGRR